MDEGTAARKGRPLGFLIYLLVAASLPSRYLFWDGIGFLERARLFELDFAHLAYVPALRAFGLLLAPLTSSEEYAAKLFSMVGGSLAFVLLWVRLARGGLSAPTAIACSLLLSASPFFWRLVGLVEPSTWTVALLLVAASAAEAWGRERSAARLAWLCLAWGLAVGFHMLSLLALPWLLFLARGPAPRPAARQLGVPLGLGALVLVVLVAMGDLGAKLASFRSYASGILPRPAEVLGLLHLHAGILWEVFPRAQPVLTVAGLLSLALLAVRDRASVRGPLCLGLAYVVPFLVIGKPVVGFLLPVGLALALAIGRALTRLERGAAGRWVPLAAALLVTAQSGRSLAFALHHAVTPDGQREAAALLASALPHEAVLFSGDLAHHVRWDTDAPVVALSHLLHAAPERGAAGWSALEAVRAEARRQLATHREVWVSSEGLAYLEASWGVASEELAPSGSETILVRAEPYLSLVLLARRDEPR